MGYLFPPFHRAVHDCLALLMIFVAEYPEAPETYVGFFRYFDFSQNGVVLKKKSKFMEKIITKLFIKKKNIQFKQKILRTSVDITFSNNVLKFWND